MFMYSADNIATMRQSSVGELHVHVKWKWVIRSLEFKSETNDVHNDMSNQKSVASIRGQKDHR